MPYPPRIIPRFSLSKTRITSSTIVPNRPRTLPRAKRRNAYCTSTASFSTTTAALYISRREPTYYEILNVSATASAAEIKKQFYSLSLKHHPDRNRSDPTASNRFATISSAYHVLSDSGKRACYDRDNGILNQNTSSTYSSANPGQHPMGSHSSYAANLHNKGSYAGSRPASGLSKRRGAFRGPPPSFYTHGRHGARSTRPGQAASASAEGAGEGGGGNTSKEDPISFINHNSVWHFHARGHFRTQSAEDIRRQKRKMRAMGLDDRDVGDAVSDGGGMIFRFVVVCGILIGAASIARVFQDPDSRVGKNGTSSLRKKDV